MFCLSEQQETRAERGFNSAAQKCSSEMQLFELSVFELRKNLRMKSQNRNDHGEDQKNR